MSYTLNHSGAEIDDLLGFLDANEYKDATVTLDDGSSLSLQNITSGSRLGLIFAVLNRWYQSIVFKSANGDVAISGAGTVGGGLTVTGAISATGGLTTGGGAIVNGSVRADSLTVLGYSDVFGELTAESVLSRDIRCAGGLVRQLASPQSGTDAANKNYVDSVAGGKVSSVNGQTGAVVLGASDVGASLSVLVGASAPTTSTIGAVGQMYINTSDGQLYVCCSVSGGISTWIRAGSTYYGVYSEDKISLISTDMLVDIVPYGNLDVGGAIIFQDAEQRDIALKGVKSPSDSTDAANKAYVDSSIATAITGAIEGGY